MEGHQENNTDDMHGDAWVDVGYICILGSFMHFFTDC